MQGPTDKNKKPASAMSQPQAPSTAEDINDDVERAQARAKLHAQQSAKSNKVAALLDATYYITEYSGSFKDPWMWFVDGDRPMTVSEYYPELKVAVDKFSAIDEHEKRLIDLKRKLLKAHGVKYGFLDGANLHTLLDQLEE